MDQIFTNVRKWKISETFYNFLLYMYVYMYM